MFDNDISKTYVNQLSTTKHCFLINYQSLYLEIRAITNIKSILSMRGSPSSLVGPLHFKNTIFEVHPRTFTRFPFTYHPPSSPPVFFSL